MADTYPITWDGDGERRYENGVDHGVLYLQKNKDTDNKPYANGVPWNGLTSVTESPSGAEPTNFYADNIKYGTMRSAEEYGGTIEAFTYPDDFKSCNGEASIASGVTIGQQARDTFGMCYRSNIGDDQSQEAGYKLHLVYGATVSPSEVTHETINDNPDAQAMSWEFDTNPVAVKDHKPTSVLTIDSTVATKAKMDALKDILYGKGSIAPRLPLPDEVATIMAAG